MRTNADEADERRSVSGVAVILAKSVVNWSSSTQGATALSTAQVEYVPTKKQRADILTKELVGADFKPHMGLLMHLHV